MKYQAKEEEIGYETIAKSDLEDCIHEAAHEDAGLIKRIKKGAQICLTGLMLSYAALGATGCASTIIQNPNIRDLTQASDGTLYYKGEKARLEYIKPWYIDMWPDTGPEYLGMALTFGAGIGVGSVISQDGGSSSKNSDVQVTTPTEPAPSTSTSTSSGGSSSGGDTYTPPPSGGDTGGGDTGGGDTGGDTGGGDDGGFVEEE